MGSLYDSGRMIACKIQHNTYAIHAITLSFHVLVFAKE